MTLSGTGGAQFASFQSPSPITLTGTFSLAGRPDAPFLPVAAAFLGGSLGPFTINGGTLDAAGGTVRIDGTASAVRVENGGTVRALGTSVGATAGQSGSLLLTGSGTSWTDVTNPSLDMPLYHSGFTTVGLDGTGSLTVTAGAALTTTRAANLGQDSGSSGTAAVSNGGSWNTKNLIVGQAGAGVLSVNGGTVLVSGGDANSTGFLTVGSAPGSQGTLTIGAGGVVRNDQPAQTAPTPNFLTNIGYQGTGTATVSGTGALLDAGVNGLTLGLGTAAS